MSDRARELGALERLRDLYRDVEAAYAGARCAESSECCRFGLTGREPQVTAVEVALIQRALAARGGTLAKKRRALPLTPRRDERICPLLEQPGRCAVYEARPLGCRTFYCRKAEFIEAPERAELRDFVRRLQAIAVDYAKDGDRPRALTSALEDELTA